MTDYLQELKNKKYQLDKELEEAIRTAIIKFEFNCELKVTAVDVTIDAVTTMGQKPVPVLMGVTTDICVLDHDNETQIILRG